MAGAFQRWVTENGGHKRVAAKLGVSEHSVTYWYKQRGSPQVDTILKLLRLSKDVLTYASIIESTHPKFKKRRAGP